MSILSFSETSFDADALAFLNAAGITDSTQMSAINTLVIGMKNYGIWTKMKAIYPFIGGTASAHKWNLKDPRDLDAAYRLTFFGGVTHGSNGISFNGITGYANTNLPGNILTLNSTHISANVVSNGGGTYTGVLIGTSVVSRLYLAPSFDGSNAYFQANNNTVSASIRSNSIGYWLLSRTSSTNEIAYLNGSRYVNKTANSTALDIGNLYIGARNNSGGTISNYLSVPLNFVSIGDGLTDVESSNLYTLVQTYQTTLGRQV